VTFPRGVGRTEALGARSEVESERGTAQSPHADGGRHTDPAAAACCSVHDDFLEDERLRGPVDGRLPGVVTDGRNHQWADPAATAGSVARRACASVVVRLRDWPRGGRYGREGSWAK